MIAGVQLEAVDASVSVRLPGAPTAIVVNWGAAAYQTGQTGLACPRAVLGSAERAEPARCIARMPNLPMADLVAGDVVLADRFARLCMRR